MSKNHGKYLMEGILHQLVGRSTVSTFQGFIHFRWCRISSINSILPELQQKVPGAKFVFFPDGCSLRLFVMLGFDTTSIWIKVTITWTWMISSYFIISAKPPLDLWNFLNKKTWLWCFPILNWYKIMCVFVGVLREMRPSKFVNFNVWNQT